MKMQRVTLIRDLIQACLLAIRADDTLVGSLAMYHDLLDAVVTAFAELIAGIATELATSGADDCNYDFGPEPRSYTEARETLGDFLGKCARIIDANYSDVSKIGFVEIEARLTTYYVLLKSR